MASNGKLSIWLLHLMCARTNFEYKTLLFVKLFGLTETKYTEYTYFTISKQALNPLTSNVLFTRSVL